MSDFKLMNTPEKIEYLFNKLNEIKPECFKEKTNQPLGDFWVCLKDAKKYDIEAYGFDDFMVALWCIDPNKATRSCNTDDLSLGYPNMDNDAGFDKAEAWMFGANREIPDWFTQENLDRGFLWVKPVIVHPKKESK